MRISILRRKSQGTKVLKSIGSGFADVGKDLFPPMPPMEIVGSEDAEISACRLQAGVVGIGVTCSGEEHVVPDVVGVVVSVLSVGPPLPLHHTE